MKTLVMIVVMMVTAGLTVILFYGCGGGGGSSSGSSSETPHWGVAERISTGTGTADFPQVAVDSNGNTTAVWTQYDGSNYNIWSNRYISGTGWGVPQAIEALAGNAYAPRVCSGPDGNAIAVWYQITTTSYGIFANHYVSGTGWTGTVRIGDDYSSRVNLAMDSAGNAMAVWQQSIVLTDNIYANVYISGTGWTGPVSIESSGADAYDPDVAMGPDGNAIAIWRQGSYYINAYANHYISGTGWTGAVLLETDESGSVYDPRVVMNSSGHAMAVWRHYNADLWANRYISGSGWATATLIEASPYSIYDDDLPEIAIDNAGNAIAVWGQESGSYESVYANRYVSGTGWAGPQLLESAAGDAARVKIAIDPAGNAVAVWYQHDGARNNVWAVRYANGTGWGAPALLETDNTGNAYNPRLKIDLTGNVITVWQQGDGVQDNIWANRFRFD